MKDEAVCLFVCLFVYTFRSSFVCVCVCDVIKHKNHIDEDATQWSTKWNE